MALTRSQSKPKRSLGEIERRVEELGEQMEKLSQLQRVSAQWWHDHAGRFEDDPVFDKIARLGKAYRQSLRPKAKRAGS